jgi:hypothetical protein
MNNAAAKAEIVTPETLLAAALEHVESASIRAWATSEHNRPIWLQIAAGAIKKAPDGSPDVHRFAAYILCNAIGL